MSGFIGVCKLIRMEGSAAPATCLTCKVVLVLAKYSLNIQQHI
jgi:hypothetical protein